MMTIYGSLHPRADVDRLYVSRKKGGRLMSIEDTEYIEEQSLSQYIDTSEEEFLTAIAINKWNGETVKY